MMVVMSVLSPVARHPLAESDRKMALARKPHRQSDLCNRGVSHSEERLHGHAPLHAR